MAWTQADIDAIKADLVTPEVSFRFSDGRELVKASIADRLKLLEYVTAEVSGTKSGGVRCRGTWFTKD